MEATARSALHCPNGCLDVLERDVQEPAFAFDVLANQPPHPGPRRVLGFVCGESGGPCNRAVQLREEQSQRRQRLPYAVSSDTGIGGGRIDRVWRGRFVAEVEQLFGTATKQWAHQVEARLEGSSRRHTG